MIPLPVQEKERLDEYGEFRPLFHQLADDSVPEARRVTIRNRLVVEHLPVAEHIARKFRNRGQPVDDLAQVAKVGLIHAVDRFDPGRGSDFLSFAVPTITGEVRRYFRDATWAIRVPRRLKELNAAITACAGQLSQELGRAPRPREIAKRLNVPIEDVHEGLQVSFAYHTSSLDTSADEETQHTGATMGHTDKRLDLVENREALYPALAALPKREASIVAMRFFGDMTQSQIAQRVGISQMHVSRLLAASLQKLRHTIMDDQAAN
ncbi:SigB/SigF/SigG family RNA polymerase sigma factor [Actinocrispum wychmicini]|uniref:SigB/SigF/SigG family RNA polymerase sigma factor n=1 Tax=Actinocrispum wychmicini TaxID=1213861 RepID=UPI001FB5812E